MNRYTLLHDYRVARGITQSKLARHCGLITQSVSNWERGTAPIPSKHYPALSEALGVDIPTLEAINLCRALSGYSTDSVSLLNRTQQLLTEGRQ